MPTPAASPPLVTAAAPSVTSQAFTAPAGSLLVAHLFYNGGGTATSYSPVITDSTGLAWTVIGQADNLTNGGGKGGVLVAWARPTTEAARTVAGAYTFLPTNPAPRTALIVRVLEGALTTGDPIGAVVLGGDTSGTFSTSLTTLAAGSRVLCAVNDWDLMAVPTPIAGVDLLAGQAVTNMTVSLLARSVDEGPAGTTATISNTAPTSTTWSTALYEVRAAPSTPATVVTRTFTFAATAEGFAPNPAAPAGTTHSYSGTVGNPAGSLQTRTSGRNRARTASWWEWAGTWQDLGVPAGATVSSVRLTGAQTRCTEYNVGASSVIGPYELRDAADTLLGTLWPGRTVSGTDGAWTATPAQPAVALPSQPSSAGIRIRLVDQQGTGNNTSAAVTSHDDQVTVEVTYAAPTADTGTANAGSGELQPSRPTMAGTGASSTTGTGSLVAKVAALTAAASISLSGVGGLTPTPPALAGAGAATVTATGSLQPSPPSLSGTAGVVAPAVVGTGALSPSPSTLAGIGEASAAAVGGLAPAAPSLTGTGTSRGTGTGALVASRPSLSGTAAARTAATGGLAPVAPTLTGTGTVITPPILEVTDDDATGTGTLVPSAPTLGGLAATRSTGTGGLTPPRPLLAGAGAVITPPVLEVSDDAAVVGEGVLVPARPTLAGLAWSRSTGAGALRPTQPTLSGTGSARASLPVVLRRGISTLLAAPVGLSTPVLVPVATSAPLLVLAALSSPQSAPAALSAVEAVLAGTSTVEPTPAGTSTLTAAGVGTSTVSEGA